MSNPARTLASRLPGDTSANTGTIRVTVNAAIATSVVWAVDRFTDLEVDVSDPRVILGAGAVMAFGYRLSRFVSGRWPGAAWLLFGIGAEPSYESSPLPPPPPQR